ncbi:MAG: ABC transporter permease [Planctomycetes bacterium]|nr:ABC transporter permease [Planctomycetota bacterium]
MGRLKFLPAAAALAFLWAPIAVLAAYSFTASRHATVWGGFSLAWYARVFENPALGPALGNTLAVGLASATLATALGTALALSLERRRAPALDALAHLPLLVPEIVMAVGLLVLFARFLRPALAPLGLEFSSLPAVVAGHVAFQIPYVMVVVRARLKDLDPSLEEAALDLGATPAQAFLRVTLPFLAPAVLAGACLSLSLSLDDFYVTYFCTAGGSGFRTLPLHIYAMQGRAGMTPEVNALATLMLGASMGLVGVSVWLQRKSHA